ncbi:MAG: TetR/AcrR family transcriptional regulator [Alphaproteobacteria bacterium]|nr:TetR/AcrR family transcriptional regulator [Alphaproteobacteria bacterium]
MTATHKADLQKKFRYHHGNLREAAITAALEILTRDGVAGLSLRALAKATGVTPTAFYESHFGDKDELLAAVAETGFQRLALQMAEDATGAPDTQTRIERLAVSYIRFATENKPLFQLMFGRELSDMKRFPTLAMTAGKSYSLISAALSKREQGGEDARFLTVAIWSLCHGLTTLVVDEKLKPEQFGVDTTEAFVKKTIGLFGSHLV